MAINTNGGILVNSPYGTARDTEWSAQQEFLRQLQAQTAEAELKAKLADPLEKAKMDATVAQFERRKGVQPMGELADTTASASSKAFTEANFPPMASHGTSAPAGLPVKGIKRLAATAPSLPETTGFGTTIPRSKITRFGTSNQSIEGQNAASDLADPNAGAIYKQQRQQAELNPAVMAAQARGDASGDKLTKVEHKDPATGRTVIEWLPESSLKGQTFQKGEAQTVESRLASAQSVNQTGEDMIAKLSDPAYAAKVGPVMGRYDTLRDFIGNPPPEFADLAGMIESYSLASMGVHGMRSAQGAEQIQKLLNQKHTPESLIATVRGLNAFSNHFMQNEGRTSPSAAGTPATGSSDPYAEYLKRHAGQ